LFPETIHLPSDVVDAVSLRSQALSRLGLDLRARSEESVSVHSIPRLLARLEPQVILRTIETHLLASSKSDDEALRVTLAELACLGARKLDAPISRNEAEALLRDLRNTNLHLPCRHGGPLLYKLSFLELARKKGEK
jgi:DNA mismatch repair ATPase MutL